MKSPISCFIESYIGDKLYETFLKALWGNSNFPKIEEGSKGPWYRGVDGLAAGRLPFWLPSARQELYWNFALLIKIIPIK